MCGPGHFHIFCGSGTFREVLLSHRTSLQQRPHWVLAAKGGLGLGTIAPCVDQRLGTSVAALVAASGI